MKKFIFIGIGKFGNICIENIPDDLKNRIYAILFKYKDEYFQLTNTEMIINYSIEDFTKYKKIKLLECDPVIIKNFSKYIFLAINLENNNDNEILFIKSILNHLYHKNKKIFLYIIIPYTYDEIKFNQIIFNNIKYIDRYVHKVTVTYYDDIIKMFTGTITHRCPYIYYASKIFSKIFIQIRILESTTSKK